MKRRFYPKKRKGGKSDWARVDSLTEEEIEAAARSDPDNPPLTEEALRRMRHVPKVRTLRMKLGMTQEEFAGRFGLSLAALRDWEQDRYEPDQAGKTLLRLIEKIPDQVQSALAKR